MPGQPIIEHISDTARWAAVYRAKETERPDALFRDPYAHRLAGDRGLEIAAAFPFHQKNSWSWVMRTFLFDRFITEQLAQGVDMVVNLAAGLDARPYRMTLPPTLQWVEVDLPGILDYKEEILASEKPVCMLERVRMDLADTVARRALFEQLAERTSGALILCEGLMIYLTASQAGALAEDLAGVRPFRNWVLDVASPALLRMIQKNTHPQFGRNVTPLQFAPEEGPAFYAHHGWNPVDVRSMLKTASRLKRLSGILRLFALLPENPRRQPWSAVCLFAKASASLK